MKLNKTIQARLLGTEIYKNTLKQQNQKDALAIPKAVKAHDGIQY